MDFLFVNSLGTVYRGSADLGRVAEMRDYALEFTDIAVTRNGRVLANTFSALYELDLAAGTYTLRTSFGTAMNGLAASADGRLYVGGSASEILVLNDRTFAEVDRIPLPAGISSSGDIYIRGDKLYYSASNARLLTIDLDTDKVVDNVYHGLQAAYGLHVSGGQLYAYDGTSSYSINPRTGNVTLEGTAPIAGAIYGSASVPDGTLRGNAGDDALRCLLAGVGAEGGAGDDLLVGSLRR